MNDIEVQPVEQEITDTGSNSVLGAFVILLGAVYGIPAAFALWCVLIGAAVHALKFALSSL